MTFCAKKSIFCSASCGYAVFGPEVRLKAAVRTVKPRQTVRLFGIEELAAGTETGFSGNWSGKYKA